MVTCAVMVAAAPAAGAHPLGNFTVNRYARIEVSGGELRVYYVLDEAEIPTFQEGSAPTADPQRFARGRSAEILAHLHLSVDGAPLRLSTGTPELSLPPGQAGLKTLHLSVLYSTAVPREGDHRATFIDDNAPDKIGWREIITTARGGGRVISSPAPSADVSKELTAYPGNLIQSPLDLRAVTFSFSASGASVAPVQFVRPARAVVRAGAGFAALINRKGSLVIVLGLLLAVGFGAVHALAPGHGKTIMAAYLVGTRGRPRDAVLLGGIVSLMHTLSVLVLGAALFQVSRATNPDRVYPYLKIASGLAIAAWGLWLVVRRGVALRRARPVVGPDLVTAVEEEIRSHDGDDHRHDGTRSHDHDHGDDHDHVSAQPHTRDDDHDQGHVRGQGHGHRHEAVATLATSGLAVGHVHGSGDLVTHDQDRDHVHQHEAHGLDRDHDHAHLEGQGDDPRHAHGAHASHGEAGHVHGPGGHSHELPEGVAPLSRRGLVLLATGGGLFPSPSAVLVLLSAFSLHRTGLGLSLIAAFSVGLAVTLTAVGLALVYGRRVVDRRRGLLPALRLLPVLSAAAITVLGLAFAVSGFTGVR